MVKRDVLNIDPAAVAAGIEHTIREQVRGTLKRRGAVVGLSGGIDSSVVAALCARALGKRQGARPLMPERDSSADCAAARPLCSPTHLGIDARRRGHRAGARRRSAATRGRTRRSAASFPEYGDGWRCKLVLPSILDGDRLNVIQLTVAEPGRRAAHRAHAAGRLPAARRGHELQAAHAQDDRVLPRRPAATTRSPARRTGSSTTRASSSSRATARPTSSRSRTSTRRRSTRSPSTSACPRRSGRRPPTTDTFSLPQTQEEFYFALPYDRDGPLPVRAQPRRAGRRGRRRGRPAAPSRSSACIKDIEAKRRADALPARAAAARRDVDEV